MSEFFIHCFIKFGSKATITDLYENGTIYCSPIQYFKTLEDKFRGDSYEGARYIHNLSPGQFQISIEGKPIERNFNYLNLHLKESYDKMPGNIYSLYCLSSKILHGDKPITIDKRVKDFGDTALLVKDNPKFLALIEEALKKKKLEYYHGLIEYYDKHIYTGMINVFNKPLDYVYQNEFRIYIRRRGDEPLKLQIGSLKDIAEIYPAHGLIDTFEVIEKK